MDGRTEARTCPREKRDTTAAVLVAQFPREHCTLTFPIAAQRNAMNDLIYTYSSTFRKSLLPSKAEIEAGYFAAPRELTSVLRGHS